MFEESFVACIRAGVPAVAVASSEWERVARDMHGIAATTGMQIAVWTYLKGLVMDDKTISTADNPLEALNALEDLSDTVVIFMNYNRNLLHPVIQQKIRELLPHCKSNGVVLAFISVSGNLPEELEKEVILLEYALPSKEAIDLVLNNFTEVTEEKAELRQKLVEAAVGLTQNEAENLIALALAKNNLIITEQAVADVKRQKAQALKKSGVLELYEPERLPKVGGLDQLKLWLWERGRAFSQEAREFGIPFPKGILVFGIPGTGKSLIAKTIAKQWDMPLLILGNILDKFVGESERKMKEALKQAEAMAPCVLMIDEVEKFFAGVGGSSDSGVSTRLFGQFLTFMQETRAPVFVVATANNITGLPPELLRKGRFDDLWFVDLPGEEEREEIFKIHISKFGRSPERFDAKKLSNATPGYTGSEIEQIVVAGLFRAFARDMDIDTDILIEAARETAPLFITMQEQITQMREWGKKRARAASSSQEAPERRISAFEVARKIRSIS